MPHRPFTIKGLSFVSLYMRDIEAAVAFYTSVFGPHEYTEENEILYGWRMGSTWLTMFPSIAGTATDRNPCNTEFAIEVSSPTEVDVLYDALIAAGATSGMTPRDTTMYVPMRFCCVDDPFGVRIDVYYPLGTDL